MYRYLTPTQQPHPHRSPYHQLLLPVESMKVNDFQVYLLNQMEKMTNGNSATAGCFPNLVIQLISG